MKRQHNKGRRGLVCEIAEFAESAVGVGLAGARRGRAARAVLDTLGVAALGSTQPVQQIVADTVRLWGEQESATILGGTRRLPATSAAFVNGTLAHCTDFDDTHLPSVLHPSSSVVAAAFATGELLDVDGPRLLDAIEVGTEISIRLGMAGYREKLADSVFFERGLHATSICGAVGAAVSASMLVAGDAASIAAAAGIAASMGSGILESNRTGGTVKQIHAGWAAKCGVTAAQLAASGLTASPTVLEGRFGFLQAFCGSDANAGVLTEGLGEIWHTNSVHIKPYPCNHFTHCAIDAAMELRARGVTPSEVRELRLGVPRPVLRTIAEPPADKARPTTGYSGAFSGPYTVVAALIGGGGLGLGIEDFTDQAVGRPEVRALLPKVTCSADTECTSIFPFQLPARLTAVLYDGRTVEAFYATNRGGPHRPLTDAEVDQKFSLNASRAFAREVIPQVALKIRALTDGATARSVGVLLRTATELHASSTPSKAFAFSQEVAQ